jgi:hypothetical protein
MLRNADGKGDAHHEQEQSDDDVKGFEGDLGEKSLAKIGAGERTHRSYRDEVPGNGLGAGGGAEHRERPPIHEQPRSIHEQPEDRLG